MAALLPPTTMARTPAIAIGVLLAGALLYAGTARWTGIGAQHVPDAATVATAELRFEDRADGGIDIRDARTGRVLSQVAPGTNGFLRSAMRGMARERKREGQGADVPFRLLGRADGRLTLEDPTTGRRIDLESFGPNAAVFAQLLPAAGSPPRRP